MLTTEEQLARVLALALYELGGSLTISNELLDKMKPVRLVWDTETEPRVVKISILSNEVLLGKVDNEEVEVVV
jgi:hypothetical protein